MRKQAKKILVILWMASCAGRRHLAGVCRYIAQGRNWDFQFFRRGGHDLTCESLEGVDGIISSTGDFQERMLREVLSRRIPLVGIDWAVPIRQNDRVSTGVSDDRQIGNAMAHHILSFGNFRSFGFVFETDARTATLVDLVGNERTLRIDRGRVTLPVGVDFETLKLAPARAKIRLVRENAVRKPRETAVIAGDSTAAWQPAFSCGGRDRVKVLVPAEPSKAHLVWAGNNDLSFNVKIRPGLGSGVLQMMVTVRDDVHANGSSGRLLYRGDSVQVKFLFPSQRENWEIFAAEKGDGTRETFVWQAPSGVDKVAANGKIRLGTAHFSSKGRNFLQYALTFPLSVLNVTEKDLTDGFAMNVTVNDDDGEGRESMMTLAGEHDSAPDRWPLVRFEKVPDARRPRLSFSRAVLKEAGQIE